jgi:hypothetical protein
LLSRRQPRIDALHRLGPGRTALLVIDMQRGFLEQGATLEVPAGRDIVPNLRRLIAASRRKGVPVVFTQFVYSAAVPCLRGDPFGPEHLPARPGRPTGLGLPSGSCLIGPLAGQGPDSAEIIAGLAPGPDELVVRGHHSTWPSLKPPTTSGSCPPAPSTWPGWRSSLMPLREPVATGRTCWITSAAQGLTFVAAGWSI